MASSRSDRFAGRRLIAATRLYRHETAIERAINKALAVHHERTLNALRRQTITAASLPVDAFDMATWDQSIDEFVAPVVGRVLNDIGNSTFNFLSLDPSVRARLLGTLDYSNQAEIFVNRVRTIGPSTASRVIEELSIGANQGEGIREMSDRLDFVFGIAERDGDRIARTETHGAAESTSHASAGAIASAGLTVLKSWIATSDERTRETHAQAEDDNQDIPYDQPYQVGDAELDYPGDPGGPPEETINCRCSQTFSMPDGEDADTPDE